jgi:hypothetical protein
MASQGDPTQPRASAQAPQTSAPPPSEPGIDLTTLLISALASAAAAFVTSKIWSQGTLYSAALSPVIVALVKEALRKPSEVVTSVVPSVARPLRSGTLSRGNGTSRTGSAPPPRDPGAPASRAMPDDLPERLDGGAPPPFPPPHAVAPAGTGPVRVYSTRGRRLRWRLAVLTGLLGFAICVVVFTVPELIAGNSVGRSGHATTFFPGKAHKHHRSSSSTTTTKSETTTTKTTTQPKTTTRPTETVTQTVTTPAAPPASTATPPGAATPDQRQQQQTQTTPAPDVQGTPAPTTSTP